MLPSEGIVDDETPELGGRKFRVGFVPPPDVGPRYLGDLDPRQAVRKERYWPMLGT